MRTKPRPREFHLLCVIFLAVCGRMAAQPPSHCAQNLFCLFNEEAAASDPAGIHKYSRDLVDLVLPNQWTYGRSPSGRMEGFENEFLGEGYANKLADRLAQAEQMARTGKGNLISDANVVRAFNELMKGIGAPPSLRTDEASVWKFREHAAALNAFPSMFSANRNGDDCYPGEAMFLIYLLIYNNGKLPEQMLDELVAMEQFVQNGNGFSTASVVTAPVSHGAGTLINVYSVRHRRGAIRLFNRCFREVGF